MKIYNKKAFALGIFLMALGVFDLVGGVMVGNLDLSSFVVIAALFVLGFTAVKRSLC